MGSMKGESWFRERGNDTEKPRSCYVAQWRKLETTHDFRMRMLPTDENLASLNRATGLTREYQLDSSSKQAGLSESGFPLGP